MLGILAVAELLRRRGERGLDAGAGDGIEGAEQLVHAVGLLLDVRLAPGALAAAALLEALTGGPLVDVVAHRVGEHVGGLLHGCGQQLGLVDGRVRRGVGDRPGVLGGDRPLSQRPGRARQVGEPFGELHLPLGAAAGLLQVAAQHLRRVRLAAPAGKFGDLVGLHRRQTRLTAPHDTQALLNALTTQRPQPHHQHIQQPQKVPRSRLAGSRRTGGRGCLWLGWVKQTRRLGRNRRTGGQDAGERSARSRFPSDNAGDRRLDQFPGGLLAGDRAGCRRVIPKREDSGRIPRDRIPRNRSARDRIPRDRIARGRTSVHRRGGWRRVREEVRVGHRWLPQGTRRCRVRVGRADKPVGEARPPLRQGPVTGTRTLHDPCDRHNTCS